MSLTKEQLEIRRTRIGSSEIGAILGVDPHRTAFDVFTAKAYPKDEPSEEMRWGSRVEAAIIEHHALQENVTWLPGHTIAHKNGITCATPDAFMIRKLSETRWVDGIEVADSRLRVLECKNVGYYRAALWGDEGDDAPFNYLAQVHWQIGHGKADSSRVEDEAHLVPVVGGTPPRKYVVQFDPELFGIMMERAEKFHRDHIATGKPPEMDGSPAADEYLRRRYGLEVQEVRPFDEEAEELRRCILAAEEQIKALEEEKQKVRQQLCERIGDSAGIDGVATWKRCKDTIETQTDWKWIAEQIGTRFDVPRDVFHALVEESTKTVTTRQGSRRLILSRPRAKKAARAA